MFVFVSYTLKDGVLTIDKLRKVKSIISIYTTCYIDILDNDSEDKQKRVISELKKSQLLIALLSPDIYKSEWVHKEYEIAKKNDIPIIEIDANDINTIEDKLSKTIYAMKNRTKTYLAGD